MHIDISGVLVNVPLLFGLGCIIGLLSGLFGVGGAALITPLLNIFFGLPFPVCIGSTLSQTCGSSFSATLRYLRFGNVDVKMALMLIGGNFVGVELGVLLLDRLRAAGEMVVGERRIPVVQFYLQCLFLVLLIGIALLFLVESVSRLRKRGRKVRKQVGLFQHIHIPPYVSFPVSRIERISLVAVVYVSMCIGVLTGLLGIGGGIIILPLLIYGYGVDTHTAIGTGLLLVFFSSTFGTVSHALRGNVDLRLVMPLLMGSTVFAQVGAMASHKIRGASVRFGFAFVVLIVAGIILYDLLRFISFG